MPLPVLLRRNRSVHAAKRHAGRVFADLYEGNAGYNARAYHLGGRPFLVHKATEGVHHVDKLHAYRCEESHRNGLAVGHYHYLSPGVSPRQQAEHFWNVVRPHFLTAWAPGHGHNAMPHAHTDFLIVDIERGSGGWSNPADELARFDHNVRQLTGNRILIGYSERSFLFEHSLQVASRKWWVASYPTFPGNLGRGRILWAHQFADNYRLPGIGQPCDASVIVDKNSIRYWENQPIN